MLDKMKIGIMGCGDISGIYLSNITQLFKEIEVTGVYDLINERAENAVGKFNLPRRYNDMHEMFADSNVDIVLNLTRPNEHFNVSMAAIQAGKHVYSEKPLGATLAEGEKLRSAALEKNVRLGCAPDTFLGAGIQTCRKLIDDGNIGTPVGATAFMMCRGHETWHPDPAFYYQLGGGPMLDMGPYYVTALISLLGPVKAVSGMAKASFPTRTITSQRRYGTVVDVEVPTYVSGLMQFACGAIGTIITSFDVYAAKLPIIEIYGSEGTLSVPDPNTFGGPVMLYRPERREFLEFPLAFEYAENSRGLGLADMAKALQTGRESRAGVDLAFHVLEVMTSFNCAAEEGKQVEIKSAPPRPAPMAKDMMKGVLD